MQRRIFVRVGQVVPQEKVELGFAEWAWGVAIALTFLAFLAGISD